MKTVNNAVQGQIMQISIGSHVDVIDLALKIYVAKHVSTRCGIIENTSVHLWVNLELLCAFTKSANTFLFVLL